MQGIFVHICIGVSLVYLWWKIFPCLLSGKHLICFACPWVCIFYWKKNRNQTSVLLHWNRDLEFDCVLSVKDKSFAFVVVIKSSSDVGLKSLKLGGKNPGFCTSLSCRKWIKTGRELQHNVSVIVGTRSSTFLVLILKTGRDFFNPIFWFVGSSVISLL